MRRLVETLENSPGVQRLIKVLAAGRSVSASGLWNTPTALLIYLASKQIDAPILAVSRGVRDAEAPQRRHGLSTQPQVVALPLTPPTKIRLPPHAFCIWPILGSLDEPRPHRVVRNILAFLT